ncbi:MAG: hypothetical protein SPJ42_03120 [Oscillospiraceae bacterium]|nr:hypothetical protein [Clostridiaceae bacterium]MDO4494544.1 hypothetical protein [Clostridiaceae bacterium]MDY5948215.1 hypothetical protein [Oscillospiraceae bacterium]
MKPNNCISEYKRVMNCVDIDEAAKQQIIKNCARYSTMKKIKSGKFRIIAVKKEKTADNA